MMNPPFHDQTHKDLQNDYEMMEILISSYILKFAKYKSRIVSQESNLSPMSYRTVEEHTNVLEKTLTNLLQKVNKRKETLQINTIADEYIEFLNVYETFRSLISIFSGILTALDTQSPSFFSSGYSQAGQFTGNIYQSFNDYARDQHQMGNEYEKVFQKEYVDAPLKFPLHTYLTQNGMSALTTIVGFILGDGPDKRPILVGKSCYFEEKILLYNLFPGRIIEVDELQIDELLVSIKTIQPSAIFLDSLCNSSTLLQPDLSLFLTKIPSLLKQKCFVVIDNTALATSFQPFSKLFFSSKHLRLIVWESLVKYHQFGLDKVNAGVIYTNIPDGINLYTFRDHLGTNIGTTAAMSLPTPNRKLFDNRLARHERNMHVLIDILNKRLETGQSKISSIVSPLVSSHPSYQISKKSLFHGSFLTLSFERSYQHIRAYKQFVKTVLSLATRNNIPLVGGTSFGFPTSRIYIPASRPGQGVPFVRIAVGTEPLLNMVNLAEIISKAL